MAHQFEPRAPGTFSNEINVTKLIRVTETKIFELRASHFNAFNQVRRVGVNTGISHKALGPALSDGPKIINTPEANAAATTGDALKIWNARIVRAWDT